MNKNKQGVLGMNKHILVYCVVEHQDREEDGLGCIIRDKTAHAVKNRE